VVVGGLPGVWLETVILPWICSWSAFYPNDEVDCEVPLGKDYEAAFTSKFRYPCRPAVIFILLLFLSFFRAVQMMVCVGDWCILPVSRKYDERGFLQLFVLGTMMKVGCMEIHVPLRVILGGNLKPLGLGEVPSE
jgi:hypothetical protein